MTDMHAPLIFFLCGIIVWYHGALFGFVVICLAGYFFWQFRVKCSSRFAFVLLVFLTFGFLRSFQMEHGREQFFEAVASFRVFSGVVVDEPVFLSDSGQKKLKIAVDNVGEEGEITVFVPSLPEVWRGQRMVVEGKIQIRDSYGKQEMTLSSPHVLEVRASTGFLYFVSRLRRYFVLRMQKLFPQSAGGFLVGILAGGSSGLSPQVASDFRRTGLTHIVAVSGSNVTILLQFLAVVFAFIRRQYRFIVLGFFVFLFVVFVGFEPSAVRAGWMGFLGLVALSFGRVKGLLLMILWSAFFMLSYDPSLLLDDRGFQLSFLATIGVSYFSPLFCEMMARWNFLKATLGDSLIEALSATLSVFLLTFPVMASFGAFPLIGLVTNLIFVVAIPGAMLLATVIFCLSFLSFSLAYFLARSASVFIDLYFQGVHFFSSLPFAVVAISPMSKYAVILYYALLLLMFAKFFLREKSTPHPQA